MVDRQQTVGHGIKRLKLGSKAAIQRNAETDEPAGLGTKDEALAELDRAYNERSALLAIYFTNDPRMDNLRSDPRFNELVRRIGLQQ